MKKEEKKQRRDLKLTKMMSVLLGAAAIATTVAYFIYRIASERAYNEKWKDYNDCGI